jgi:hypothetical protein
MKNTTHKAILYDDHCPMCALYTQGFVKWGVLKPENRVAFTQANEVLPPEANTVRLDPIRSRHEIPLIDLHGGPTPYGIDAMVYLLRQRVPLIGKIMQLKPVYAFFRFLYALVSYNRRIMVPSSGPTATFDCTPLYHRGYRLAFIGYGIVLASLITMAFGESVAGYWPVPGAAVLFLEKKAVDYLGHLSVLMIIGTLVLLPGMALSHATQYQFPAIPAISVLMSSSLMTWQHIRRVRHLGLSQWWTAAWFLSLQTTAALQLTMSSE